MKKKRKRRAVIVVLILLLLLISGGAYYYFIYLDNDVPFVEDKKELNIYDVNSNKRPIAVMIDNKKSQIVEPAVNWGLLIPAKPPGF